TRQCAVLPLAATADRCAAVRGFPQPVLIVPWRKPSVARARWARRTRGRTVIGEPKDNGLQITEQVPSRRCPIAWPAAIAALVALAACGGGEQSSSTDGTG